MKISTWKRTVAWGLALATTMSLTACGGSKGGVNSNNGSNSAKVNADTKNMVYSGEEIDLKDVEGEPGSFVVEGDKIYFLTSEYLDSNGNKMFSDSEEGDTEDAGSDEEKSEEEVTEEASEEEKSEEETTEEATEEEKSEETTEEEKSEEEASTEENAEDVAEEETPDKSPDAEDYTVVTRLYSMDFDTSNITKICEPSLESKNEYVQDYMFDKDKNIILFSASYDQKTESQKYFLSKLDENGKVTEHEDFTEAIGGGQDMYISKVFLDEKGNYIILSDQSVFILDSSYKKVAEVKNDEGWIEGAAKTLDGKIICGVSGEDGANVKVLDVDAKKFGDTIKLDIQYFGSSDSLINGCGDYDFYYKTDKGIFGYSIKAKAATQVLDYLVSEINSNNSYGIVPIDAETMIGSSWDEAGSKFVLYKKVDPSQVKDKITITFGSLWGTDDKIKNAAIKFNKENDKYRIAFQDYGDSEEPATKMNADIVAGNIPDIIDLSYLPVEQYVEKGILEDLTPYLEKDDVISKDDFIPSVEKAMEIDGKLYYMTSSFTLQSLLASKKDVGDRTGWNFKELYDLLEEKGKDVRPFYSENKGDTLRNFLYSCIDDYIDWGSGECKFNSDEFKSMLEVANRGTDEEMEYDEDSPNMAELVRDGTVLFSDGYVDIDSLQEYKAMFGSDLTFIGYPCEDKKGSYFSLNNKIGIYAKSEAKEGAWEFIRTLMTKEAQVGDGYMWSNPTNKDAFEMFMKSKTATEKYKDEFGNEIEPVEGSWGYDGFEIEMKPLSKDEEQLYRDLVNNTTKVVTYDDSVMNIITEEAANYFNGQKSLDETADIIQNRVTTYVNESR